ESQANWYVMTRKRLEVRLDSKRYRSRKREERRSMGMRWYDACREVQHWQFATRWHHCGRSERKRDATIRRGPYKGRAHVWHSLAAILTMVSMRRAMHWIAALHRLFCVCRGKAVKCIRGKRKTNHCDKNWPQQTHYSAG